MFIDSVEKIEVKEKQEKRKLSCKKYYSTLLHHRNKTSFYVSNLKYTFSIKLLVILAYKERKSIITEKI